MYAKLTGHAEESHPSDAVAKQCTRHHNARICSCNPTTEYVGGTSDNDTEITHRMIDLPMPSNRWVNALDEIAIYQWY